MSKLFQILFSRIFIVFILIVFQVGFIVLLLNAAADYYWLIDTLLRIISFIYIIRLFKRDIPSATRVPLIILIIAFPIIGIFIYYFSMENHLRKRFIKNFKNQTFTLESLYIENNDITEQLLSEDKEIYRQSQFIAQNTYLPAYANNLTQYFTSGEELFDKMLEDLKTAKHFIFLEYFIIGKGALWDSILSILKQKVREGVEVRVIFDDVGSYKTLPYKYNKKLEKLGIKCVVFNPISPTISITHNNRDHKKITVIDGKISYTGGLNVADEYINKKVRFGYWKDVGMRIVGDATKSFTLMFLETWHYFRDSSEECSIYLNIPISMEYQEVGYIQPFNSDPMLDTSIARSIYLNMIQDASDYIYIATPYLALDDEFMNALIAAQKRGVDVRLIIPHIPDKKYIYRVSTMYGQELIKNHITLYEYEPGFLHSKLLVTDDKLAVCGTANFDYRSFYHNYECGVWLYHTDSVLAIKQDFEEMFEKAILIDENYVKKHTNALKNLYGSILKIFAPLL